MHGDWVYDFSNLIVKIFTEDNLMKKKTANVIKGIGVAMAVGSVVAAESDYMGTNSASTKKAMQKAVSRVSDFVDTVSSMM